MIERESIEVLQVILKFLVEPRARSEALESSRCRNMFISALSTVVGVWSCLRADPSEAAVGAWLIRPMSIDGRTRGRNVGNIVRVFVVGMKLKGREQVSCHA